MPQMEQSSYATSAIPTFGSAVTRTADVYNQPNGGTYFNSSGVLTNAPANTPRLDHSPSSPFAPMGILIEESRTNALPYSIPDGGTNWTYTADNTVGTANVTTAADGSSTAASLADTSSSTSHYATPTATVSVTSEMTYNFSVFIKPSTATYVQIGFPLSLFSSPVSAGIFANFNLMAGTVANGVTSNATIQALANGWFRCTLFGTAGSTGSGSPYVGLTNNATTGGLQPSYAGSGETLYVWGAQFETGQNPTSYIPTSGSTVTRAVDAFTVPGTAGGGSGWITNNVGTLGTVGSIFSLNGNAQGFAGLDNGTVSQGVFTQVGSGGNRGVVQYSSGQTYGSNAGTYLPGKTTKIVFAFSPNYENGAADGALVSSSGTVAPPATQNRLTIGHTRGTSVADLDGWDTRIWYQPVADADTTLTDYSR